MYAPINGWTKTKIIEHVMANFKGKAVDGASGSCRYLTEDGKKCAVGLFIPDGHPSQTSKLTADMILSQHSELRGLMPLPPGALLGLQGAHDDAMPPETALDAILDWIDGYVVDPEEPS